MENHPIKNHTSHCKLNFRLQFTFKPELNTKYEKKKHTDSERYQKQNFVYAFSVL